MPRVTRPGLRSQVSPDNSQLAAASPLPATSPVTKRAPLGEITGNQEELPARVEGSEAPKRTGKGLGKGKKGKTSKKSKKINDSLDEKKSENVLPDDNESEVSSAVEDACQELLKEQSQNISTSIVHGQGPYSPSSPAVMATADFLSQSSSPQSQNPATVTPLEQIDMNHNAETDHNTAVSAAEDLSASGDAKAVLSESHFPDQDTHEQNELPSKQNEQENLARTVMRPEDSIEAMDKLEDEIEKVGDLIPATKDNTYSSKRSKRNAQLSTANKVPVGNKDFIDLKVHKVPLPRKAGSPVKPEAAAVSKTGVAVYPSVYEADACKADTDNRKVSDTSNVSEKISNATKKRISSVHKAPFVPAKSTKRPTRSNFELPGEAVARKFKEAREERMKREEEEKAKKPAFKARPVRLSQAPVVKLTAASRARISMAKGESPLATVAKDSTPTSGISPDPCAAVVSSAGKRPSTLSKCKASAPAPANSSARVVRGPSNPSASTKAITAKPITQSSLRQSVSATDAAQLKAKGREVFNRGRMEQDERDRMRKEKEEAAKKARAEAAERGRIASREWAEKQKLKKMAEKKVNTDADGEASAATS
ncbi:MAG: hypothetical protein Q9219_001953 [cf. Caloplaca sp. 3 TL-2023]